MYCGIPLCSGIGRSEEDNILEDNEEILLFVFKVLSFHCFFEVFVTILFSLLISDRKSVCNIDNNEL